MTVYDRSWLGLTVSTRPRPRGASHARCPSLRWARSKRHATRPPCPRCAGQRWRDLGSLSRRCGQPCVWEYPSGPSSEAEACGAGGHSDWENPIIARRHAWSWKAMVVRSRSAD